MIKVLTNLLVFKIYNKEGKIRYLVRYIIKRERYDI